MLASIEIPSGVMRVLKRENSLVKHMKRLSQPELLPQLERTPSKIITKSSGIINTTELPMLRRHVSQPSLLGEKRQKVLYINTLCGSGLEEDKNVQKKIRRKVRKVEPREVNTVSVPEEIKLKKVDLSKRKMREIVIREMKKQVVKKKHDKPYFDGWEIEDYFE